MFTAAHNPFDFASPVIEGSKFAGRQSERDDAKYYLNEAQYTRPVHLALTGERAAGKTSMLNMIADQAALLNFLVVRVDLNSGDAEPTSFFLSLYDSILLSVVRDGGFGGLAGPTWPKYRALIDADVPAPDLPLNFPAHIAATLNGTRRLSVAVLRQDLLDIQTETDKKVVVIIDECDTLASSRISLEILRNLFTDLPRFMFVIAGTPRLFPVIDDVFSPITRQFKKIAIEPFKEESDTRDCIEQQLREVGLEAKEVFADWDAAADEIHQITGGRPYEIQLLCHTMFRRVQENLEEKLSVSLDALDAVRKELEQNQADSVGRMSHLFSGLSRGSLVALNMIRKVAEGTVEAALAAASVTPASWGEPEPLSSESLARELAELTELGILVQDGLRFSLGGDQFDEVYLRYLAASHSIRIASYPSPVRYLIDQFLREALGPVPTAVHSWFNTPLNEFEDLIFGALNARPSSSAQPRPDQWKAIFRAVKSAQDAHAETVTFEFFTVNIGETSSLSYFTVFGDEFYEALQSEDYESFADKVRGASGSIEHFPISFPIKDVPPIRELLPTSDLTSILISNSYENDAFQLYSVHDYLGASERFQIALEIRPSARYAVSAAFMALNMGDWDSAIEWTVAADALPVKESEWIQRDLALYNRALANVMIGERHTAIDLLDGLLANARSAYPNVILLRAVVDDAMWHLVPAEMELPDEVRELLSVLAQFGIHSTPVESSESFDITIER